MTWYRCSVCHVFEYDTSRGNSITKVKPGTHPENFLEDWRCPICGASKEHMVLFEKEAEIVPDVQESELDSYLGEWKRDSDDVEIYMADIHDISATGESIIEPMRTRRDVISWDQILVKGAQLFKMPLNSEDDVSTQTIIGPKAKHPLVIETPIIITHMSFGALSKEVKTALSMGSASVKSAICSGEGGILEESFSQAYKYIFEYVPNQYSVTEENLKRVDAIEIKFGQSVKPGMGGYLPAEKVTEEIAKIRGFPAGTDIISPSHYEDILNKDDLRKKVEWLREKSDGKPIGIKLAAGHLEEDLDIAIYSNPDFITIDGRPGATAAASKFVKESTSIPTIFALYRAKKFFEKRNVKDISLIITGGLRVSSDFAKALAIGADAVAIGSAALIACGCQQYKMCHTGKCPVGITTQNPELRQRLNVTYSAKKLENFLRVSTEELKNFARLTGNDSVHKMDLKDLCTTNSEISKHTEISHV